MNVMDTEHELLHIVMDKSLSLLEERKNNDVCCPHCFEVAKENCLRCDICTQVYHQQCSGLTSEVFDSLVDIIRHTGWVCLDCRTKTCSMLNAFRVALTQIQEELADMRTTMAW